MNPAREWLLARLTRGPATPREVLDDALTTGITHKELAEAKLALQVVDEQRTTDDGKKYTVWVLPKVIPGTFRPGFDPRRPAAPPPVLIPATSVPTVTPKPKLDPRQSVQKAKERLQKLAPRHARYLSELTERASQDAAPCPTCGRGTPRAEALRLQALVAALDRAGVSVPKTDPFGGEEHGPVLVFPPGTQMGLIAKPPADYVAPAVPQAQLVRADLAGEGQ